MSTPWYVPILSTAAGGLLVLAGTALTAWNARRLDLKQRLRERRAELYVDLAEYIEDLRRGLPTITDPTVDHIPLEDLKHLGRLDARVRLLAPVGVRDTWFAVFTCGRELFRAYDAGEFRQVERSNGEFTELLPPGDPRVTAYAAALDETTAALRRAMSNLDLG